MRKAKNRRHSSTILHSACCCCRVPADRLLSRFLLFFLVRRSSITFNGDSKPKMVNDITLFSVTPNITRARDADGCAGTVRYVGPVAR
jgi:hypothetical protein